MSENPPSRALRRQETPDEVREERYENYEGFRSDVQHFIDSTYYKLRQHPGMLKNGQGVKKQEKLELWGKGKLHCCVEFIYTENSTSKGGRPKKEGNLASLD